MDLGLSLCMRVQVMLGEVGCLGMIAHGYRDLNDDPQGGSCDLHGYCGFNLRYHHVPPRITLEAFYRYVQSMRLHLGCEFCDFILTERRQWRDIHRLNCSVG